MPAPRTVLGLCMALGPCVVLGPCRCVVLGGACCMELHGARTVRSTQCRSHARWLPARLVPGLQPAPQAHHAALLRVGAPRSFPALKPPTPCPNPLQTWGVLGGGLGWGFCSAPGMQQGLVPHWV